MTPIVSRKPWALGSSADTSTRKPRKASCFERVKEAFAVHSAEHPSSPLYMVFDANFRAKYLVGPLMKSSFKPDFMLPKIYFDEGFLFAIHCMRMGRFVIVEVHSNHDPKESTHLGHSFSILPSPVRTRG